MCDQLKITRSEFTDILKNRGKHVSSKINDDSLLKKIKYLNKQDLVHLATIRGLAVDESSLDNILYELYKNAHKQKLKNIKQEIYRNLQKRKNIKINKELKRLKRLKQSNLAKKENISQKE